MEAVTPANEDPVFEVIERCCEAWKKCDEAWEKTPGGASHNEVTKLINSHTDVEQATPDTISGSE